MNLIIREPIILECGTLFMRHVQWRLHQLNADAGRHGNDHMILNAQVFTCDAAGCDEVLDMIARHSGQDVTLARESSGYYAVRVQK